jgi:hypothetical protein
MSRRQSGVRGARAVYSRGGAATSACSRGSGRPRPAWRRRRRAREGIGHDADSARSGKPTSVDVSRPSSSRRVNPGWFCPKARTVRLVQVVHRRNPRAAQRPPRVWRSGAREVQGNRLCATPLRIHVRNQALSRTPALLHPRNSGSHASTLYCRKRLGCAPGDWPEQYRAGYHDLPKLDRSSLYRLDGHRGRHLR